MFIKSLNLEVTFNPYTRKIQKAVQNALMENVEFSPGDVNPSFPAKNADKSEEILISMISGLSVDQLDSLLDEEYQELKKAINEKIVGEKKGNGQVGETYT